MRRASIKYLAISLILILCLLPGISCSLLPDIDISLPDNETETGSPPTDGPAIIDTSWTLPTVEGQAPILPSIADVVAKVKPSVVAINTESVTYDIFNRPYTQEGAGSGWIIDESGIIVTNNHVVEGAKSVTVTLSDDRGFPAEIISTDALTDLAVIKIKGGTLPAATIGNASMLRVGDWLVAIGNPLGLGISAKEGIVSRVGVPISVSSGQTIYDLIETSAAINPGNSGGPLVNMAGEVIGITSIKIATTGVEGMGYAINIDTAAPIIEELITTGYVVRPWLGVVLFTVDEWTASRYRLAVDEGALVTEVAANSPADKAGLKVGDIIVSINGEEVSTTHELVQELHSCQIGQKIEIIFWRDNTRKTTTVTVTECPPPS